ncbi:MAG: glycosyltransferase family 4 protein [Fimbriimonas sp.]|nr:glycosyltransferase family 4 protein [Fimbriimonas sp.]
MKILQVGSSLMSWGGIERYVAYLSDGLAERGHDVVVSCGPDTPLHSHITVPAIPIVNRRKLDFPAMAKYLRLFRATRYDVIHVHFSPDFLLPTIAARMTKQPYVIMTRHVVLPWTATKVKLYSALYDHFIPVSHAVERQLEASGVPKRKMTVAKAGCPPLVPARQREETRRELGIDDDRFAIGFFGRLVAEKGVDTLINASAATERRVSFEVFGEGPLSAPLEVRAQEAGSRVRFHGFREDVPECLKAIDAVVIPSVWEEAFPYAALEAMSVGRAVIASRVGGMAEIVEEGSTGYLFNKHDASGLATVASRMASDPEANLLMGLRAMEVHRTTYTTQKMAERIETVYRSQATLL